MDVPILDLLIYSLFLSVFSIYYKKPHSYFKYSYAIR